MLEQTCLCSIYHYGTSADKFLSVLLDDVLAAVDSHVARHIFSGYLRNSRKDRSLTRITLAKVIGPQGILATKARILVTNSVSFVKHFDQLVYIRRGIILENGAYDVLMADTEGEMARLV